MFFSFAKGTTKDNMICHSDSPHRRKMTLPKILPSIDRANLHADEQQVLKRIEFEQTFDLTILQLTQEEQRIYDQNPHLREVFLNSEQLIYYTQDFNDENRQLPRLSLNRSLSTSKNHRDSVTNEYWEQRKILLSEIEFLTKFAVQNDCLVIYAGGASTTHLNYLSALFPQVKFVLIDENCSVTNETDQIEIKSENFTDQLANDYSQMNKALLFICNIGAFTSNDKDMKNQITWHSIMKPNASLFKFCLPQTQQTIEFLQGQLLLDLWSSKESYECRLIVEKDAKMFEYNCRDIERALIHFHNTTRTMYYEHDFDNIETEGIDHCYDCRAEIFILQQYVIRTEQVNDDKQLKTTIAKLSYDISRNIHQKHRQPIINVLRTLNIIPKI